MLRGLAMAPDWPVERHRALLRLHAQQFRLDPRLAARFDLSDLVSETLLRACRQRDQFRGSTEAELIAWLRHPGRAVVEAARLRGAADAAARAGLGLGRGELQHLDGGAGGGLHGAAL
jgi:DNA-directed RNA polymerase specialized sigma24 family protein